MAGVVDAGRAALNHPVTKFLMENPVLNAGVGVLQGASDYKRLRGEGGGVVTSFARAAATNLIWTTCGMTTALAIMYGPKLVKGAVSGLYSRYQTNAIESRRMVTPFAHSFSHTDATLRAQQNGLQSITGGRGYLGSEAGLMQQLYGRR